MTARARSMSAVNSPPEDRSPLAEASAWASRIMTISAEMVVPGLIGLWLDRWLGTWFLLALAGFAGGLTLGIWHLIRLTGPDAKRKTSDAKRKTSDDGPSAENLKR